MSDDSTFGVPKVSNAPTAETKAKSLCSHSKTVLSGPHKVSPRVHRTPVPATRTEYWLMRIHYNTIMHSNTINTVQAECPTYSPFVCSLSSQSWEAFVARHKQQKHWLSEKIEIQPKEGASKLHKPRKLRQWEGLCSQLLTRELGLPYSRIKLMK